MTATVLEDDRELWSLTEAMCDGTITLAQRDRLQVLLETGRSAMRFYLAYLDQHASMLWQIRGTAETVEDLSKNNIPLFRVAGGRAEGDAPAVPGHRFALPRPPNVLVFPGNGVRWTREYFSQPGPLSILAAAIFMVCTVSLLSILPAPTHEPSNSNHACNTSTNSPPRQPRDRDSDKAGKLNLVARITGMHNCKWSAEGRAPYGCDHLGIGRELKLDSGIVEITYYNGVKIVLEGPVEFKVEKPNACRLELGKLAAEVSERAVGFTVETPTTTVVDLGTEFAVVADATGATDVHVFLGAVEFNSGVDGQGNVQKVRIEAGQARRVDATGRVVASSIPLADTRQFVRTMPPPVLKARGPLADSDAGRSLLVWLRADAGVAADAGGRVVVWHDLSGNGYRFTRSANFKGSDPALVKNALAGKPVVRFDGRDDILSSTDEMQLFESGDSGLTVFVVFNTTRSDSAKQMLVNFGSSEGTPKKNINFELGINSGFIGKGKGRFGVHRGYGLTTITDEGLIGAEKFVIMTTLVGSQGNAPQNVSFYKNGTLVPGIAILYEKGTWIPGTGDRGGGWLAAGKYPTASVPLDIGARIDGNRKGFHDSWRPDALFSGDLAEILIYRRALNESDRRAVEQYLRNKWF